MTFSERTKELLSRGENTCIEYKRSVSQDFNDTLVAFANGSGGVCLFGVDDDKDLDGNHIGKPVGIEVSDRTRGRIQSRADQTHDKIDINIATEENDGLGIYIVEIPEGKNKPYCTSGGRYLVRRNGQNTAVTPSMMERMIEHRIAVAPGNQPLLRFATKDVKILPPISADNDRGIILGSRFEVTLMGKVVNIGERAAQNVLIDGRVMFKRKRGDHSELPTHAPEFFDFLSPERSARKRASRRFRVRFDGYIAGEIVRDFFDNRESWPGMMMNPTRSQFEDRTVWPSPRLDILCFYTDVHGQHYVSERSHFFHLWVNKNNGQLECYLLNISEPIFSGQRKISSLERNAFLERQQPLRAFAFDGESRGPAPYFLSVVKRGEP